jgi:hypothetical protein
MEHFNYLACSLASSVQVLNRADELRVGEVAFLPLQSFQHVIPPDTARKRAG